jgi:hypothetical protein
MLEDEDQPPDAPARDDRLGSSAAGNSGKRKA